MTSVGEPTRNNDRPRWTREESIPFHLQNEIDFILDAWESGQTPAGNDVKLKGLDGIS